MKFGVLAASTAIAVASLAPASFAQSSSAPSQHTARAIQGGPVARTMSAQVPNHNAVAPTLHNAKPAAGMLPQKPTGTAGSFARGTSSEAQSSDLRRALQP